MSRWRTRRLVWLVGAFIVLSAPAAGTFDLDAWTRAIDRPRIGSPVELGNALELGWARLEPEPQCTVRELRANGSRCGLLLDGPARLIVQIRDPFMIPVAERNLKHATSLRWSHLEDGSLRIEEALKGAIVWGLELPVPPGIGAGRRDMPLPKWLLTLLEEPAFPHPSHELAEQAFSGAHGTVYAIVHGKHEDLLLDRDPIVDQLEGLWVIKRVPSRDPVNGGRAYPLPVAAQPLGRHWWDRVTAPLTAIHEDLDVRNAGGETVTVRAKTTLRSSRSGVGLWRASLVQRTSRDRKVFPVEVRSVLVDGKPASWVHQDGELLVRLYPTPPAGGSIEVEVVNEGSFAIRPTGDAYWSMGTWGWYPQPSLNSELATLDIHVAVPDGLTPFASGDTVARKSEKGVTHLHTHLDKSVQFPVVVAGDYHVFSDTRNGVRCDVATYVFGKKKAASLLLDFFFTAGRVYEEYFRQPYPYREMDIVEIHSWGWGQAPPGVIFITREAFSPLSDTISQIFSQGVNERIAHEIAHSWWGHVLKMDSTEEQWLTESFAEYSAALLLRAAAGSDRKGKRLFKKMLTSWKSGAAMLGDGASIYLHAYMARDDEADAMDNIRLLYNKGPVVIHAIRLRLQKKLGAKQGDRYFWALLRAFLKRSKDGYGSTVELIAILNRITGDDWQPWFERYVYGCETPL